MNLKIVEKEDNIKIFDKKYRFENEPENDIKPKSISYEDILSKMGMYVSDGRLNLIDKNQMPQIQKIQQIQQTQKIQQTQQIQQTQIQQTQIQQTPQQTSYIYNKYFKEELMPQQSIRKPRTMQEYKLMLLQDMIQKQRIKNIKSTKLVMPTANINISGTRNNQNGLQDKLFNFSRK